MGGVYWNTCFCYVLVLSEGSVSILLLDWANKRCMGCPLRQGGVVRLCVCVLIVALLVEKL